MSILIIIPARGGSKGIPRKNLRPLNGKPLIFHSLELANEIRNIADIFVSSDDDEIIHIVEKFGTRTLKRDPNLAKDQTTLDPVIHDAYEQAQKITNKNYDIVITLQPTSPLLTKRSLQKALERLNGNPSIDTIISAEDDTHLTWRNINDKFEPNYEKRVNRQHLPKIYKETGGFIITRAENVTPTNRIGKNIELF